MKRLLYLSNVPVPYRVKFFNELSKLCDLTVLYERRDSSNRDSQWTHSEKINFNAVFLEGIKLRGENSFSIRIVKWIFGKYDAVIIGCCNSPVQIFAALLLKMFRVSYYLNSDGEIMTKKGLKGKLKYCIYRGAGGYLTAGNVSADSFKSFYPDKRILSYNFSSLTKSEVEKNASLAHRYGSFILVIGQYLDYKGLEIAVGVARMTPEIKYKFIGTGKRTEMFIKQCGISNADNIEVVPFMQKEELVNEFLTCRLLLLPSRAECWGLVINEAASYGTPIASTWGSGAAVEFLAGSKFEKCLAEPSDIQSLREAIDFALKSDIKEYSNYLIQKSKDYNIDDMARRHSLFIDRFRA